MGREIRPPSWASLDTGAPAERLAAVLFDPGPVTELGSALTALAARLCVALEMDVAGFMVSEDDPSETTQALAFARSELDVRLRPLLESGGDLAGLGGQVVGTGASRVWPRLGVEPAVLGRLAAAGLDGDEAREVLALLDEASAAAVPLATPNHLQLGVVLLISLDPVTPITAGLARRLEEVAPQLSLTVRNHQLRDRNRRTRQVLEAVLESTHNGVVVTDLRERLVLANRAAAELIAVDLAGMIGSPMRDLVRDRLRWRFADPGAYVQATLALYDDPEASFADVLRTVDGRVVERYSAPVRDLSGELLGRVDILSDVTAAQEALAEARRLAEEAASLRLQEERRAQEAMSLARAAHLMASALTRADIHEHLVEQAIELSGAESGGVLIVERDGDVAAAAVRGISAESLERLGGAAGGEAMLRRVLTGRRPVMCSDVEAEGAGARAAAPRGVRAFVHQPLTIGERVYGLLTVGSPRPRAFGERELRLLGELARHAGAALQNAAQFEQERHIAETLQHALLPDALPVVPGLAIGGLYRAAAGAQVGGDFYGVWTLPDGTVAVLVGDVSGKGVEAAGITAMVRYVTEGLTACESDPSRVLTMLNDRILDRVPDGAFVTMVLVTVDPGRERLRWCSAGHVAPLLVGATGEVTPLGVSGPPCGAFPDVAYPASAAAFAPGDTLLCFTDGVIEARRDGEEFGEERVIETLRGQLGRPPRELARAVLSAVSVWSGGRILDDVAIAVVARPGP